MSAAITADPPTGPPRASHPLVRRALATAVAVLAAPGLVTLLAFTSVRPIIPALLYIVAILTATAVGGRWGALPAAAASFVPFTYFFLSPRHRLDFNGLEGLTVLAVFAITAVIGSEMIERQRAARARAERAVRTSRQALDAATRLQRVADALATALTPQEVLDAVLTEGVEAAEARGGLIALLSEDGEWLEIAASRGYDERWIGPFSRFPVDGDYPLSEAVREGVGVFMHSERERDSRYPELAGRSQPGHGLACLPLTVERGTIGGLVFSFPTDQDFPPARRALKQALARQAAVALERARLISAEQQLRERISFLGEATAILGESLDLERTLERLSALAVPTLADWCAIDLLGNEGEIERVVVAHQDPERARWADELRRRTRPHVDDAGGVAAVIRTGEPTFMPEIPRELLEQAASQNPNAAEILASVELRGFICVPLQVGDRTLGAVTLVAEDERLFTEADFEMASQLAARAAVAVENARLFREAERRADAALALSYVGDGVALLDRTGRVRYWNAALVAITGVAEEEILGRRVEEVVPAWRELAPHVELAPADAPEQARPVTIPFAVADRERWVAVTGVEFDEGVVYALRDVSEEQALERARSDFVATASHELRTPLAAVYGAARTLRRPDLELLPEQRETFLEIIESETDRLTGIVTQILLAGQLDSGRLDVAADACDLHGLAESVLASTRLRVPETIELQLTSEDGNGGRPVALADEDKLRQVLVNLVDNAIKYSPDGGVVEVRVGRDERRARVAVRDGGLGIPPEERERIFEKFYRLDPALTRGVGGSGLGLYICRELVTRMGGTIRVEGSAGGGSTFVVELPGA
ncbi:MAG TPA: ATP-binding protein [Gaiellaceae bacterium]|nr:ATP-binding protein [Gaiellaceae bacterium]